MEYIIICMFLQDDDVKEGDGDLIVVIVGMYVEGICIDDIDVVDIFFDVYIFWEFNVDVVVKDCFDVFGDVLESLVCVEFCDLVLDVVVIMFDFLFVVMFMYVMVDELVFVVDGKKDVFVICIVERVVEVVGCFVFVVQGCEGMMVIFGLKYCIFKGEFFVKCICYRKS